MIYIVFITYRECTMTIKYLVAGFSISLLLVTSLYSDADDYLAFPIDKNYINILKPAGGEEIVRGETFSVSWERRKSREFTNKLLIEVVRSKSKRVTKKFKVQDTREYDINFRFLDGEYFIRISGTGSEKKIFDESGFFRIMKLDEPEIRKKKTAQIKKSSTKTHLECKISLADLSQGLKIQGENDGVLYDLGSTFSLHAEYIFDVTPNFKWGIGAGTQSPAALEEYNGAFYFVAGYVTFKYNFGKGGLTPYILFDLGVDFLKSDVAFRTDFYDEVITDIPVNATEKQIGYYAQFGFGIKIKQDYLVELSYSIYTGNIEEGEDTIYLMNYSRVKLSIGTLF